MLDKSVTDWSVAADHLIAVEPRFASVVKAHGHPPMAKSRDLFASLGRSIVYQQLSGAAAGTINGRFCKLLTGSEKKFPRPEQILATDIPTLRSVGLSENKAKSLLDLAARVASGEVPLQKLAKVPHEELLTKLLPVRGIGPWSIDMFAMFALARPDVMPVGDLGVQKGMKQFLGLRSMPTPAVMMKRSATWAPYRSAAAWYMWRVLEG